MKVVFLSQNLFERPAKFALALKNLGHDIHLITAETSPKNEFTPFFESVYTGVSDPISILKNFPERVPIHHFSSNVDNFTLSLLVSKRRFFFDYKDIFPTLLSLPSHGHDQILDFLISGNYPIIHRDGQILEYSRRRNLSVADSLHHIPDFIWPNIELGCDNLIVPTHNRLKTIVFAGNFSLERVEPFWAGNGQIAIIRALIDQGLTYVMYPYRHDESDKNADLMADYHHLSTLSSNFILRQRVSVTKLNRALRQAGWGSLLIPSLHCEDLRSAHYVVAPNMSLPARISDYLAAGLPILTSAENIECNDWVRTYGIGLAIDRTDLSQVGARIVDCDYVRLRRNVFDFCRDFLNWEKWGRKLSTLYKEHF